MIVRHIIIKRDLTIHNKVNKWNMAYTLYIWQYHNCESIMSCYEVLSFSLTLWYGSALTIIMTILLLPWDINHMQSMSVVWSGNQRMKWRPLERQSRKKYWRESYKIRKGFILWLVLNKKGLLFLKSILHYFTPISLSIPYQMQNCKIVS